METHKNHIAVSRSFNLGLVFATWASRVPDVRNLLLLTATTLGYVLLFRGLGTLVMMPIIAWLFQNLVQRMLLYSWDLW